MKNVWLAVIGLAVIGYGCGPRLAETPYGQKELEWKEYLGQAYPSWEAPQTVPPVESIVPEPGQMGASSNTTYPEAQEINPGSTGSNAAPTSATMPGLKPLPADSGATVAPAAPASLPAADAVPTAPAIDNAPAAAKAPALDAGIPEASSAAAPVFTPSKAPAATAKTGVKAAKPAAHTAAAAAPAPAAGAQEYVVKKGDTLGKIALKFYKNAGKYKVIENANKDVLGKKGLRAGMKLHIPAL